MSDIKTNNEFVSNIWFSFFFGITYSLCKNHTVKILLSDFLGKEVDNLWYATNFFPHRLGLLFDLSHSSSSYTHLWNQRCIFEVNNKILFFTGDKNNISSECE